MLQFIHISDLHFHQSRNDNKSATGTLKYIEQTYPSHRLLVTGDITDDGSSTQYGRALEALSPFMGRIFICPGNHDFGAKGMFYEESRAMRFDDMLATPLGQQGTFAGATRPVVNLVSDGTIQVLVIALDSNLETTSPFDFACGKIGDAQLQALDEILAFQPDPEIKKLLMFHHHPFIINDPFMEMKDADRLWNMVYNRIDVMLFGHKHDSRLWQDLNAVDYVLASDDSPGKNFAREISVGPGGITVQDIPIAPNGVTSLSVRSGGRKSGRGIAVKKVRISGKTGTPSTGGLAPRKGVASMGSMKTSRRKK